MYLLTSDSDEVYDVVERRSLVDKHLSGPHTDYSYQRAVDPSTSIHSATAAAINNIINTFYFYHVATVTLFYVRQR